MDNTHKLSIRVQDKDKDIVIDENGNRYLPTKWVEVKEINLGSINKPNKEIIEVKLEPLEYSKEKDGKQDMKKWFDPWM